MGLFTTRKKLEEKYGIPREAVRIIYYGEYSYKLSKEIYFWKDKDTLYFEDPNVCSKPITIPKENILSFNTIGEYSEEQRVSGGKIKGGGVSLGGAVAGGVLLGTVGVLLGGRKKVKSTPIKSETAVTDTRKVVLNFIEKGEKEKMILDYYMHDELCTICPEKNGDTHEIVEKDIESNINTVKDDVIVQIKKLADLKEQGILTEEEFIKKKTELLAKI